MKRRRPMRFSTKKKISRAKRRAAKYAASGGLLGTSAALVPIAVYTKKSVGHTKRLMNDYSTKNQKIQDIKRTVGQTFIAGRKDPLEMEKYRQLQKLYEKKYKPMEAEVTQIGQQLNRRKVIHNLEDFAVGGILGGAALAGTTLGIKYMERKDRKTRGRKKRR